MNGTAGPVTGWVVALAAVVGLFVGSFLNVVVFRTPLGLSVSTPRSFCPTCDRQLAWWENVPLVSWLALRGRCHTCHERISVRYPLVEVSTSVAFGLTAWAWHGTAPSAGYCALGATAVAVGLIEFGGQRAPLSVGAFGVVVGQLLVVAAALWLGRWGVLWWSLFGSAVGSAVYAFLRAHDPDCRDPRWYGRSLLPAAGCWLGGLGGLGGHGARPVVAGMAAWILAEFACMVVLSVRLGRRRAADGTVPTGGMVLTVASVPLVTGIAVALVVSLAVAA